MNLNTSFTGDDNLYTRIKTGNHASWSKTKSVYNTYLSSGNGNGDVLEVDKLWYTTPVGDSNHTVTFGPKIENYYMHATTPSIYEPVLKAFTLGGNAAAYGASTSPGVGWAYIADNGFAMSSNITSKNPIFTNEAKQSWASGALSTSQILVYIHKSIYSRGLRPLPPTPKKQIIAKRICAAARATRTLY